MCCSEGDSGLPAVSVCVDCGEPVDEDGNSLDICTYSPVLCETCNDAPCDQSC